MSAKRRLARKTLRGGITGSTAVFLWLLLGGAATPAAAREVVQVRHFTAPEHTRIVLDMSGPGSFEVRRVGNPDRLAINVPGAALAAGEPLVLSDGLVQCIRRNPGARRAQIVVDLDRSASFRSFSLPATGGSLDRIVVDVLRATAGETTGKPPEPGDRSEAVDPFVVIIDPGHGGMDPGAVRDGIAEKDVVLEVSREMARLLNAVPGYSAHLTRTGDYGLALWQRVELAREREGDLFLSVHCNTHPSGDVGGMEVYFLSLDGATDREAQELADKENAAELVGLDPADAPSDGVMGILVDLQATRVLRESSRLAHHVLDAGIAGGLVDGGRVKQARFHVLQNLAMPSTLVELAYMSHAGDMAVLSERQGRRELAGDVVEGVLSWRRDRAGLAQLAGAAGSAWTRNYRVRRGDSLWGLARRHGTTVGEITRRNDLVSGAINVGQELTLPAADREP